MRTKSKQNYLQFLYLFMCVNEGKFEGMYKICVSPSQIAECEQELERLLSVQGERERTDPEEYSLLVEEAGFPSHEV